MAIPKILFVASEMGGYIKSGGLGEVCEALPLAMSGICEVRVLLPGFPAVVSSQSIEIVNQVPGTADLPPWSLGRFTSPLGLTIYVVLCDELYKREGTPYGNAHGTDFEDNDIRFARLSLAAAEIASGEADASWQPDVVHVNDWPSALASGYLRWKNLSTPSILTIHNLAYQGLFRSDRLQALGIPQDAFCMNGVEFHGQLSFLKAGLVYASHLTTVSETYAREITTVENGCGLDGLLAGRMSDGKLTGIVNGIDGSWREIAESLKANSSVLQWKQKSADAVRRAFGLQTTQGPLFSIVSRLVHQKGIDLSIAAAETIVANGGQLVVMGRGEPTLERAVRDLAKKNPGTVAARIGFNDEEARSVLSGSDFLLMPSRFEPCGLSQMYAQSVAALPIASRTGGLADTIDDGKSGFLFDTPSFATLTKAVSRALSTFSSKPDFHEMRRCALEKTFEWKASAKRYRDVYAAALG